MTNTLKPRILIGLIAALMAAYISMPGAMAATDPTAIGVGAKPMSLGRMYVGGDDIHALFINPAGLGRTDKMQITSMTAKLLGEIDYHMLAGVYPTSFGTFGIGYVSSSSGPVYLTTYNQGTGKILAAGTTFSFGSNAMLLSYGGTSKNLGRLPILGMFKNYDLTFGGSFKSFRQGFAGIAEASANGYDLDMGVQYRPLKWALIGASLKNILPSSTGAKLTWSNGREEGLSATAKVGGVVKLWGELGKPEGVLVGLDFDTAVTKNTPALMHFGMEWNPLKLCALRWGVDQTDTAAGAVSNMTAGLGLKVGGVTFDYAYHQYYDLPSNATHFFTISYDIAPLFGRVASRPEKPVVEIAKAPFGSAQAVALKTQRQSFLDVPEGYWAKEAIEEISAAGIMDGFSNGIFKPEEGLTRAEICALIIKAKGLVRQAHHPERPVPSGIEGSRGMETPKGEVPNLKDVPKTHWAAPAIKKAIELKLMSTSKGGAFEPEKSLTRVEGIVVLARLSGLPTPTVLSASPFPDVSVKHWAAPTLIAAQKAGLLGYLNGRNFEGGKNITRAEAAYILSRIVKD